MSTTPNFSLPAIFDNPMGWGPPAAAKRTPVVRSKEGDDNEDGDDNAAKATIAFLDGMAPPSAESERAAAAQAATFAAAIGPFGPFSRFDKLGRIVDWTASSASSSHSFQQNQKSSWKASHHPSSNNTNTPALGLSSSAFERRTEEDDKDFTLVDSKAASRPRMNYNQFRFRKFQPIAAAQAVRRASNGAQSAPSAPAAAPQNRPAVQRTANTGGGSAWGRGNAAQRVVAAGMAGQPSQNRQQRAPTTQRGNAQQRPAAGKPGFNRFPMNGLNNRRFEQSGGKLPSVDISESWKLEKEIDFNALSSTLSYPLESEDLVTAGTVEKYVVAYNNVNARLPKVLQRFENRQFFVATTSEDPVLQRLSSENKGEVYATEAILSVLMAAFKSNASFDIIVKKENGKIFFDNRPNGRIDYVNVNEGILDNPAAAAEPDGVNHPVQLSEEATFINHNFSQCIVKGEPKALDEANPFLSGLHDGHEPASMAFRYRRFKLADGVNVIARTAVNGYSTSDKGDSFIMTRALNEYDPKLTQVDWRQKLDSQPGAVLAAEMKLHIFKFARWAAEAQLCGADEIRLGFVSRENFKSSYRHTILKVSKFTQNEFSKAMNVQIRQLWGSLRAIIDSCQQLADGKYLLIRDPNKTTVNIYAVPNDVSLDEIVDASSTASSANQNS